MYDSALFSKKYGTLFEHYLKNYSCLIPIVFTLDLRMNSALMAWQLKPHWVFLEILGIIQADVRFPIFRQSTEYALQYKTISFSFSANHQSHPWNDQNHKSHPGTGLSLPCVYIYVIFSIIMPVWKTMSPWTATKLLECLPSPSQ